MSCRRALTLTCEGFISQQLPMETLRRPTPPPPPDRLSWTDSDDDATTGRHVTSAGVQIQSSEAEIQSGFPTYQIGSASTWDPDILGESAFRLVRTENPAGIRPSKIGSGRLWCKQTAIMEAVEHKHKFKIPKE